MTNLRRLEKLADFLENEVPEKRFKFGHWVSPEARGMYGKSRHINHGYYENWVTYLPPPKKAECGTTACALGWATAIPSFRRAGLMLVDGNPVWLQSRYVPMSAADHAAEFFDISRDAASALFMGHSLPGVLREASQNASLGVVTRRIRQFIAHTKKQQEKNR